MADACGYLESHLKEANQVRKEVDSLFELLSVEEKREFFNS